MWVLFKTCLVLLCILCDSYNLPEKDVADFIQEVEYGKAAKILCKSNDENHNFMLWVFDKNVVIGPGNRYNRSKYEYEVLSGNLYIKSTSMADAGLYRCISRGIRQADLHMKTTRVLVQKDWEDVWEHSQMVNIFRIIIVIASFIIISGGSYIFYLYWRRKRYNSSNYLEESDEDSSDEVFMAMPGPSSETNKAEHLPEEMDDSLLAVDVGDSGLIKLN